MPPLKWLVKGMFLFCLSYSKDFERLKESIGEHHRQAAQQPGSIPSSSVVSIDAPVIQDLRIMVTHGFRDQ
jgi:hypothetical protein